MRNLIDARSAGRMVGLLIVALIVAITGFAPAALLAAPLVVGDVDYAEISSTAVADVQSTFKRIYLMAVDAVPDFTPLSAQLTRSTKFRPGPDGLRFNVKTETGAKVANVPDAKLLPTPSRPRRKAGTANAVWTYTVVAVGGQSIALTQDSKQAFVSDLKDNFDDAMVRTKLDMEREYNGDGSGILCQLETVASAPVYDVRYPFNINGGGIGTMLLIEGMEVALINPSNGAERDRQTIVEDGVDHDAETMEVGAAFDNDEIGDYVVLCNDVEATGSDAANNYNAEAGGILAATGNGDEFEGIDGDDVRRWNGTEIDAGTTVITEKRIAKLEAHLKAKSGQKPDLFYTTRGISIEMQDQLAGLRRFSGETQKMKGGYDGLSIGGRTVMEGDFCPKGFFFGINTKKEFVGCMDLGKKGFVDLDGAKLHRIEGRHAYRADLAFAHNLIWFSRNAHGRIKALTDDTSIIRS